MPFFENSGTGSSVDALLLIGLCLMSGFDSSRKRHHGRQTTRQVLVIIEFVRSLAVHFRWSGTAIPMLMALMAPTGRSPLGSRPSWPFSFGGRVQLQWKEKQAYSNGSHKAAGIVLSLGPHPCEQAKPKPRPQADDAEPAMVRRPRWQLRNESAHLRLWEIPSLARKRNTLGPVEDYLKQLRSSDLARRPSELT